MTTEKKIVDYCRVCGIPSAIPREDLQHELCSSCGAHIGLDDIDLEAVRSYREEWLKTGPVWWRKRTQPPKDWDPIEQMKNIPPEWR